MNADKIRQYVIERYVRPAQARGEKTVSLTAGEVQAERNPLWQLRGIAKDMFEKPDEWEDLIKQERKQLSDSLDRTGR